MIVSLEQIITFFLVFVRLSGMIQLAPFFDQRSITPLAKAILALWAAALMMFVVPLPPTLPNTPGTVFLAAIVELMIGVLMGFVMQLIVIGIEFAGALSDTQGGMSAASALDPTSGRTNTLLSLLLQRIAVLIFLIINGHHLLLAAVFQSFTILPLGAPVRMVAATESLIKLGTKLFVIGIQFSAPILLTMFLIDFGFGILSKVAPQVNVFQLSFQVKPMVAVFIFLAIVPGLMSGMIFLFEEMTEDLLRLFNVMRPL